VSATTTFRSDFRAGCYGLLTGYKAATSGRLNSVHRARPLNFDDRPFAYIRRITEQVPPIRQGNWNRNATCQIVFIWGPGDAAEIGDIRDDVVDEFMTYVIDRPHATSATTLTEPRGTDDVEIEHDGAYYPATVVTLSGQAREGRS